ncbi:unnamed protein product [Soboliphyme baturini]|uniref:N-terminal Ras-GEF domain-containing protein n=1 Tax=Soboliphyme baturini TaxID=241478 RepID=A0A183JAD4_9BILA|nr:unnamed protein product [Soboliphyme baturini]
MYSLCARYSVIAGTPEKLLEYLLETRIDCEKEETNSDTFMEDFLLTHSIFMPTNVLCNALSVYYRQGCSTVSGDWTLEEPYASTAEQMVAFRRRVILFLQQWVIVSGQMFFEDPVGPAFIEVHCQRVYLNTALPAFVSGSVLV